jgi:hypothetical protein
MDLDPIETHQNSTKDEPKDQMKHKGAAITCSKQSKKPKPSISNGRPLTMSSTSGITKRTRGERRRSALERELEELHEEEREYRKATGENEDGERREGPDRKEDKKDNGRRARRKAVIQTLFMRNAVEDLSSKMGELGMEKEHEKQV